MKIRGIVLLTMLASTGAFAADSVNQLIDLAYKNNSNLKSQVQSEDASDFARKKAASEFLPTLSVFADRTKTERSGYLTSDTTTLTTGYKLQWNLFSGFSSVNSYRGYSSDFAASQSKTLLVKSQVRSELLKAIVDYSVSIKAIETWKKLLRMQKDQLLVVQLKYNNGLDALWTVDLTKANIEVTEATITAELAKVEVAKAKVSSLTGSEGLELNSAQFLDHLVAAEVEVSSANENLELKQLQYSADAYERAASAKMAGYLPSVNFVYQNADSKPDHQSKTNETSVGVNLVWSVFDGFGTYFTHSKAKAEALAVKYKAESLAVQSKALQTQYLLSWDVRKKQLKAKEAELKASRLWSETIEKQYRLGSRNFSAWDQAQSKQFLLEKEYLTALANACYSKIDLEQWLGKTEGL